MWRDDAWVLDMLQASRKALAFSAGLDEAAFYSNELVQSAVVRQLTIVGEAAKRVSPEFRAAHTDVPWKRIAGFRDVVVHDYFRVDPKQVWEIVRNDLANLIAELEKLVPPDPDPPKGQP